MMSETSWIVLRRLFVSDYAQFRRQLERLTGSADLASEALQDTYVRLAQGGEIGNDLANPRSYLLTMALNSARKILRKDRVRTRYIELAERIGMDVADESPGPEKIADARSDIVAVKAVLASMPERRRSIFLLALFEDMPLPEIARRHNIGLRMVQMELKKAREEIAGRFLGSNVLDFASVGPEGLEG